MSTSILDKPKSSSHRKRRRATEKIGERNKFDFSIGSNMDIIEK